LTRADWGGAGRGGVGQARPRWARVERSRGGTGQGGGWAEVGRDQGGAGQGGAGRGGPRSGTAEVVWGAAVARAVGGEGGADRSAWKRCEREKREKERAGPDILAYVHRTDTSADEHKQAALYGGRDDHPMNISYMYQFKNRWT
jgi:hypothetical protein